MTPPLRLWGREFEGFRRAVEAHAAAWPAGTVSATWLGLSELQAGALGPTLPAADVLVVPADWLPNAFWAATRRGARRAVRGRSGRGVRRHRAPLLPDRSRLSLIAARVVAATAPGACHDLGKHTA